MIFVTGGAYQGKTGYVKERYNISDNEIWDMGMGDLNSISSTGIRCVKNYQLYVKRLAEQGGDPIEASRDIISQRSDIIIIMDEIGNGIIPIDRKDRIYREQTGITGCFLAKQAGKVIRVVCGIGVEI